MSPSTARDGTPSAETDDWKAGLPRARLSMSTAMYVKRDKLTSGAVPDCTGIAYILSS